MIISILIFIASKVFDALLIIVRLFIRALVELSKALINLLKKLINRGGNKCQKE